MDGMQQKKKAKETGEEETAVWGWGTVFSALFIELCYLISLAMSFPIARGLNPVGLLLVAIS